MTIKWIPVSLWILKGFFRGGKKKKRKNAAALQKTQELILVAAYIGIDLKIWDNQLLQLKISKRDICVTKIFELLISFQEQVNKYLKFSSADVPKGHRYQIPVWAHPPYFAHQT